MDGEELLLGRDDAVARSIRKLHSLVCFPPLLTSLPAILPDAYHARTQLVPAWHALRAYARGLVEFAGFQEARYETKLTQGIITDGFIQRV